MLKNTAEGDTAVFFVCHKTTHPPARAALPFRLGDAFCARRVLLLVLVDLDITGCILILNEQQRGGQGHRQSSEDGEQCFVSSLLGKSGAERGTFRSFWLPLV